MQPGQLRNTLPFIFNLLYNRVYNFSIRNFRFLIDNCPKGGYNTAKPTNHIGLTEI